MRKLYKLKNWYSLEDAAKRLTVTLEEDFSVNELLRMVIEGHVPLSWYMRHIPAREMAPYTKIWNWDKASQVLKKISGIIEEHEPDKFQVSPSLAAQSKEVDYLNGIYRLDLEMSGAIKDWILSLVTNTGGKLIGLDGYFVRDSEGSLWQVLEQFSRKEQNVEREACNLPPLPIDLSKSPFHQDNYYPSDGCPDVEDLGITRHDLEAFEASLIDAPSQKERLLKTNERNTLYKLIIGMAVENYRYNPNLLKSSAVTNIASALQRANVPLSDDTIRNKLREAAELLPEPVGRP